MIQTPTKPPTDVMRIVRLDAVGPPENLKIVSVKIPSVGPDEVLIETALAGIIYGDTEARRGTYFSETILPFFPGREVAGTIVATGSNVTSHKVGDRVMALVLTGGGCAEYVLASTTPKAKPDGSMAPPADIISLPDQVSFAEALPYLVNFRLAYMLFHGSSRVPDGATVLVHGASGGMGSMMTQIARAQNCLIFATCRTEEEATFCQRLGADHVIRTGEADYVSTILKMTDGRGVDFSFNGVGGDTLNRDVDVLVPFGEIQAYGYVAGKTPFDTFRVGKCIALKTFAADDFFPTPIFGESTAAMQNWFKNGPLIEVGTILPLDQVVEAHRLLDAGNVTGKIALQP